MWDDWQKMFEAKARYVAPEFRVSNLLEQLAEPVRKSVEVHFEALGQDDTSQVNYNDVCDYIRSEFQREDVVNDILLQYKQLQQGDMTIREYITKRKEKRTDLQNLGIKIDEWMEKSLWLDSISEHLRRAVKKEHDYSVQIRSTLT
eukprot:SAG11_NODE_7404_length_1148_cov_7.352717_1_plen_146_part_00